MPRSAAEARWYHEHSGKCPDCGVKLKTPYAKRCRPCSKKGSRNPNYKDELATDNAGHYRTRSLYPVDGMCRDCESKPAQDIHHVDRNSRNIEFSNLAFLCHYCHMQRHKRAGDGGGRPKGS